MPTPKAPARQFIAWQQPVSYKVRIKGLLLAKRNQHPDLTKEDIKKYRLRLRSAVGFYIGRARTEKTAHLTTTEKNLKFQKISTASKRLAEALKQQKSPTTWAKRLGNELDMNDLNVPIQTIITQHLRERGLWLKDFLDMAWACKRMPSDLETIKTHNGQEFSREEIISHLNHLSTISTESSDFPRWSDPDLYFFIEQLAVLWVEATGRTAKRTEATDGSKKYLFAEWVIAILKNAGCRRTITTRQISDIATRLKIKNKRPY